MITLPKRMRFIWTAMSILFCLAIIKLGFEHIGPAVLVFGLPPAMMAGACFGPRGALWFGFVNLCFLFFAQNMVDLQDGWRPPVLAACIFTVTGFVVGRIVDLQARLERELALHRKTQTQLAEHQTQLLTAAKFSALGEMAGGMAHEINSPLTAILMRAQQIKSLVNRGQIDKAELEKCCNSIEKMSNRISKVIHGLKKFSRSDESRDSFVDADLELIIDDTLALCAEKFRNHGIELSVSLPAEKVFLPCRPVEISQVLLNILNNAADATEGQSKRVVKIEAVSRETTAVFKISDNGVGIVPDVAKKLFEPFYTTKAVGKGTGLGLSISLGIVKKHHGQLTLDTSQPHTCFVVELPRRR